MLELLAPYLDFIAFLLTLLLNVLLIFLKSQWYVYLIANVLLIFVELAIGIPPFDFVLEFIKYIFETIGEWIKGWFTIKSLS